MQTSPSTTVEPPASLTQCAERIEREMDDRLALPEAPERLREAVRYAALGGGKRLRPALAMQCSEAVGGLVERALPAAAAVEFVHAFSLVHDDLPAMDDDDLRRGRPTAHMAFDEATAVLAGDFLLNLAYATLSERSLNAELSSSLSAELAEGTGAMIAGQVYDTVGGFPPGLSERDRLALIHRQKTSALIRTAARMGALCGLGGPPAPGSSGEASLRALTIYGESVGFMFQVVDDLLDVEQSAEHTGKGTNKDVQAGKITYPGVLGVEASRREVARLRDQAREAIAPLGAAARALRELCDFLAARTK